MYIHILALLHSFAEEDNEEIIDINIDAKMLQMQFHRELQKNALYIWG